MDGQVGKYTFIQVTLLAAFGSTYSSYSLLQEKRRQVGKILLKVNLKPKISLIVVLSETRNADSKINQGTLLILNPDFKGKPGKYSKNKFGSFCLPNLQITSHKTSHDLIVV